MAVSAKEARVIQAGIDSACSSSREAAAAALTAEREIVLLRADVAKLTQDLAISNALFTALQYKVQNLEIELVNISVKVNNGSRTNNSS